MNEHMSPRVTQIVISVADLMRSEGVYTSVMGFREVARGEGPSAELARLWNLPPGTTLKWVLLEKPQEPNSIKLRVVQFTPTAERSRYEYREQDNGFLGLHICATDVPAAYHALIDRGFTAMHAPVEWAGGGGELGVGKDTWYEVFMHGYDGEEFIIIPGGLGGCQIPEGESFGLISNIVLSSGSTSNSYAFYHGVLGMVETDKRWEGHGPSMETMLRLPHGTVALPVFYGNPAPSARTSIITTEFAGVAKIDLYKRNAPPYRGLIIMTFETTNVQHLYEEMVLGGIEVVLPPVRISDQPYAGRETFSVRGPDGVFIEFSQRK